MVKIVLKENKKINEKFYTEKLANGLTVYIVPKQGYYKTFAMLAAKYGSIDTVYKLDDQLIKTPSGVAHFLEHLMFNTAEGNALTKLSANGANANAYTSTNTTAYYFECVDGFYENLKILMDFVSVPYFTEESIRTEQGIITQEILMSDDDPDFNLYYGLLQSLFKSNNIRFPIAGTVSSLEKITPDILMNCFNTFYDPSNMVLCIAGDVESSTIIKMAEETFSSTAMGLLRRKFCFEDELKPYNNHCSKVMDVSLPIFLAGCKSPPPETGCNILRNSLIGMVALDMLAGHSSKLYIKLYEDGFVNSDFSASYDFISDAAYIYFGGETRDPVYVLNEIKKEITNISISGHAPSYFDRIKKAALGSYTRSLNSFEAICSGIIDGHFYNYDALSAFDILSAMKESDIISFYNDNLFPDNMAISIIHPA